MRRVASSYGQRSPAPGLAPGPAAAQHRAKGNACASEEAALGQRAGRCRAGSRQLEPAQDGDDPCQYGTDQPHAWTERAAGPLKMLWSPEITVPDRPPEQ